MVTEKGSTRSNSCARLVLRPQWHIQEKASCRTARATPRIRWRNHDPREGIQGRTRGERFARLHRGRRPGTLQRQPRDVEIDDAGGLVADQGGVNPFVLLLRGVKHLQDDADGTRAELDLCILSGLGIDQSFNPALPAAGT
jgi:hypothetical protein